MGNKEPLGGTLTGKDKINKSPELKERIKKTSESLSEAMENDATVRQIFRNRKKDKKPFRLSE